MNSTAAPHGKSLHPHRLFTFFKWTIYLLLLGNTLYFLQEDLLSLTALYEGQVTWGNVAQVFSAFMDTLGWLILLLVFEFETAIIPDEYLHGPLNWLLLAIKVICYFFIVSAFFGYIAEYMTFQDILEFGSANVCELAGQGWNYVLWLDEYPVLDATACLSLQGQELFRVAGSELIGTADAIAHAQRLTIIDVINAGTWLVIVALLEVEVRLQINETLTDRTIQLLAWSKGFFYLLLVVCAIWWMVDGEFVDYWDAILWLVAFIFIELNIFQWHEEVDSHIHQQTSELE